MLLYWIGYYIQGNGEYKNSTFFYFPHILAFYVQRNLDSESATESSGLASSKHQTMSILSLTKAMARHNNLVMLLTQPHISFTSLSITNQNMDMWLLLDYFSIRGEETEKKKDSGHKHTKIHFPQAAIQQAVLIEQGQETSSRTMQLHKPALRWKNISSTSSEINYIFLFCQQKCNRRLQSPS